LQAFCMKHSCDQVPIAYIKQLWKHAQVEVGKTMELLVHTDTHTHTHTHTPLLSQADGREIHYGKRTGCVDPQHYQTVPAAYTGSLSLSLSILLPPRHGMMPRGSLS